MNQTDARNGIIFGSLVGIGRISRPGIAIAGISRTTIAVRRIAITRIAVTRRRVWISPTVRPLALNIWTRLERRRKLTHRRPLILILLRRPAAPRSRSLILPLILSLHGVRVLSLILLHLVLHRSRSGSGSLIRYLNLVRSRVLGRV